MQKNNAEARRLNSINISSSSSSVSTRSVSTIQVDSDSTEVPILRNGDSRLAISHLSPKEEDHRSGDIVSFEIDLDLLPYSLHKFCQQVGIEPAVVVEHLLLDAYQEILYTLAEEDVREEVKSRFRSVLENEFVMGRISRDALEKAMHYGWLKDSDVKAIKRLRKSFRVLLDEPSGT
jgi:hypothetical protein